MSAKSANSGSVGTEAVNSGSASSESAEALDVLRAIWRGHGQTAANLDDDCGQKTCKRMDDAGVGYDDFAGAEGDLRTAWRARLEHEGKLNPAGETIRDLVLGSVESR